MLTQPQYSVLSFDGTAFQLSPGHGGGQTTIKDRVLEEGLETILFYWANELLPAPRLLVLARSNPVVTEQDLLAVDDLGRIHIFELKKDRGTAESLHQLVSYLVQRPRNDAEWVGESATSWLWYGEQQAGNYLGGLVGRARIATLGTDASRRGARAKERYDAQLVQVSRLAGERSGLGVAPQALRLMAAGLLDRQFGGTWTQALAEPELLLKRISAARLPSWWRLGMTRPGIVIWMIAPDISEALQAARPFVERRLEVRCVSVDVRETVPGREWSIGVAAPADQAEHWRLSDTVARLLGQAVGLHLQQCPDAQERVHVLLPPDCQPRWTGIAWEVAGEALVWLAVHPDQIEVGLYYDWWTEGLCLRARDAVHRVSREVRARHPKSWPWSSREPDADCNRQFVEGLAHMASDYWRSLKEIGALDLDAWAFWKPAE